MLTPKQIENLPENLVNLYSKAESDILADMARRIASYGYFIPAAEHQYKKTIEMGLFHEEIMKRLSSMLNTTNKEIEALMQEAGVQAIKADDEIYKEAGLNPQPIGVSKGLSDTMTAGITATQGLFDNLTRTTAKTTTRQFEIALDRAYMQITTGAFDSNSAIRMAIKSLSEKGVAAIEYPSGRTDSIEVAVRRAVVTGTNQTAAKMQEARADEMECDLVETTAHAGARPSHLVWQGKIFSRSGKHPKYPDFKTSTGYGTGEGLCGWNCRHNFFPFFEGVSRRAYSEKALRSYNAEKYTYNGQKMTEYEAVSKQRYIERQIRRWKREEAGMRGAGLPTDDAKSKISRWQETQKDFIKQTGLKRQAYREQIGKTVDKSRLSFNKHYEKDNKNGIITIRDKGRITGGYSVKQSDIDDIVKNDLRGIKFSGRPTYSGRITTQGRTSIELYEWGEPKRVSRMLIGKQLTNTKEELLDTIIHEELEARIALRSTKKHRSILNKNTETHKYINDVISRYLRLRGIKNGLG